MNSMTDPTMQNKILNVGGPDKPLTNQMLGEMMFRAINTEPKFVYAPTWIFDSLISLFTNILSLLTKLQPQNAALLEKIDDIIETTKIGKYYAVEDMLTTDPSEKFGKIGMQDHYNKIATKGQDPFTPVRATAVISQVIENGPLMLLSLIPAFFMWRNPEMVTELVPVADVNGDISLLLARFF